MDVKESRHGEPQPEEEEESQADDDEDDEEEEEEEEEEESLPTLELGKPSVPLQHDWRL